MNLAWPHRWRRALLGALLGLGAAVAPCPPQAPPGWQTMDLPDTHGLVYAVRLHGGYRADPAAERGVCRVLAECRLRHARQTVPTVATSGVVVQDDTVVAYAAVAPGESLQAQRFVAALLDPAPALTDDLLALVAARVALAADDAAWFYPGQMLASRARRELGGGSLGGLAGDAEACLALRPARVRALLAQPCFAAGLVLGKLPARPFEYLPEVTLAPAKAERVVTLAPAVAERVVTLAPAVAERGDRLLELRHPRVDGPFAAVAYAIPSGIDRAALAVGLEVARARAMRLMPPLSKELTARAPRLLWSWLADDAVAVACRRGGNGAPPQAPLAELEHWLADLLRQPPTAAECQQAIRSLQQEFWLPPGTAAQQAALVSPAALATQAVAFLQAAATGRDPASFAAVTAADATAALRQVLTGSAPWRAAAVPATSSKFGSFTTGF